MKDRDTTTRSRELGIELRRARKRAGYGVYELADRLGWSGSRVSRLENGQRGVSSIDVTAYLVYCGVLGDELKRVLALMENIWADDWLQSSDDIRVLVSHETTAQCIRQYEPLVVPGLLQTENYARALFQVAGLVPQDRIEAYVRIRMERKNLLYRKERAKLTFFVAEQALRSPIGGNRVMNEQMLQLLLLSAEPSCQVRVVPQSFPQGAFGPPFRLMEYRDHRPVAYLDNQTHLLFLEKDTVIDMYRAVLDRLDAVTLDYAQSRELFSVLAYEYDVAEEGQT